MNWHLIAAQLLNGLALGSILALVALGLTITFGLLGLVNFAHGVFFMVGAYAGFVTFQYTHSFALAVLMGTLVVLVVGVVVERVVIRLFYRRPPEDQILVTFGLAIVIVEIVRAIFGGKTQLFPMPSWGMGATNLGFLVYPNYRLQVIVIAAITLVAIYLVLYKTRLGLIVRAGIDDSLIVNILGIDVTKTLLAVFVIGAMVAGFSGVIDAPIVAVDPDMGASVLIESFVVVVIGGLGSFSGSILGGIIAGEIISITTIWAPDYAQVMLYLAMALVLILRPQGLFGTEGRL
ncbi:branched-chain amino acid ABC transporter permease [bacterium]|nr:MAG: branched-chain amino acid ABC transporter permease [bacterium]